MRSHFDEQLEQLSRELIEMGALCEEVIALDAQALEGGDPSVAKKVSPLDAEIDRRERNIEALCLKLLLQQQPVARDLRQISAALKMITDMERIGDQAEDIAEIIMFLGSRGAENSAMMRQMARAAMKMVTDSVDAYVKHDIIRGGRRRGGRLFRSGQNRTDRKDRRRPRGRGVRAGSADDRQVFRAYWRSCGQYCRMGHFLRDRGA